MIDNRDQVIEELLRRVAQLEASARVHQYEPPDKSYPNKCGTHGTRGWIESIPRGSGYCQICAQEEYKAAPRCPHCGTKRGFAFGTGDCGCEDEY